MTSRGICQNVGMSLRKGEHFPFLDKNGAHKNKACPKRSAPALLSRWWLTGAALAAGGPAGGGGPSSVAPSAKISAKDMTRLVLEAAGKAPPLAEETVE